MVEVIKRTKLSSEIQCLLLKAQEDGCPLSFLVQALVGPCGFEILGVDMGSYFGGYLLEMPLNNKWAPEVLEFLSSEVGKRV